MTTANALDPPPVRRRVGQVPSPRALAVIAGVLVVAVVIFAVAYIVFGHAKPQLESARAGSERGGTASQTVQPPPAVTPQMTAETRSNLAALQRAANAPGLVAHAGQVASVSPPAGRVPSGVGVTPRSTSVGPSNE